MTDPIPMAGATAAPTTPATTETAKDEGADAAQQAHQVGSHGVEQARDVASTAAEHASDLASTTAGVTSELADTVKEQVVDLRDTVRDQTRDLVDQATTQLSEQAQTQTERVGQALSQLADQAAALAEGRIGEAGDCVGYAAQAAQQLRGVSERLETGGFDGLLSDVTRFARRKPGTFLLTAAGLGLLAGRIGRGAQAASGPATPQPAASPAPLPPITGSSIEGSAAAPAMVPPVATPAPPLTTATVPVEPLS